jgi:hypothetical protein
MVTNSASFPQQVDDFAHQMSSNAKLPKDSFVCHGAIMVAMYDTTVMLKPREQ